MCLGCMHHLAICFLPPPALCFLVLYFLFSLLQSSFFLCVCILYYALNSLFIISLFILSHCFLQRLQYSSLIYHSLSELKLFSSLLFSLLIYCVLVVYITCIYGINIKTHHYVFALNAHFFKGFMRIKETVFLHPSS